MDPYLTIAESHSPDWELPFDKTSYYQEIAEYWQDKYAELFGQKLEFELLIALQISTFPIALTLSLSLACSPRTGHWHQQYHARVRIWPINL
ncbi:hypothetical protein RIB2604_00601430 [Aspergillus luchuensis]|uniref:Uncharacterized protein n=1 Tax=Aspergillus kawachii TaxID=1069201 RepID=A0A146EZU4_ASPKA|nr:hypothetical protein RIB2604_00601430 [Aspergillus luchuensis]